MSYKNAVSLSKIFDLLLQSSDFKVISTKIFLNFYNQVLPVSTFITSQFTKIFNLKHKSLWKLRSTTRLPESLKIIWIG
jgi:hypothetical protein